MLHEHSLTREFVPYLTKKHTVFRVIIKVAEKLVIIRLTKNMILDLQNNFLHILVYMFCVITRSLLQHTDLNITEFLTEIPINSLWNT